MKQRLSIINTLILLMVVHVTSQGLERWIGRLAIVTGASSGVGEATSRALVNKGINVLGLARRENRLQELQKNLTQSHGSFYYLKCNVRNETDIINAFKYAEEHFGGVDIMINNAGIAKDNLFEALEISDMHAQTDTNLIAPVIFIREAIKSMRKHKKEGHIINMNSVLGLDIHLLNLPLNIYTATKFGLRAATDNVRLEMAKANDTIRLTSIFPSMIKSEFGHKAGFDDETMRVLHSQSLQPEDIANSIIYALSVPPHVQIEDIVITRLLASG